MKKRGITLFEVLLAIAILGGAMVAIGEMMRTGSRSAIEAREVTRAQLYAETIIAEIAAGILPSQASSQQPHPTDPDWLYTVESDSSSQSGLLMIRVTMQQANLPPNKRPLNFSLVRWMIDPSIDLADPALTGSGSSTSNSSGSSSNSGGTSTSGSGSGSSSGGTSTGGVN
jgi:type II secretory pathway pseudopilin PulG